MTGIDSYSTTPATNATATGGAVNWAEGQAPSTVNNSERQVLTDTRNAFNDLVWFQYGTGTQGAGNIAVPAVYSSATVFTIAGADVTAAYHVYRRVRAVGASTGTIYGTISVTSYAPTTTTVTVVWDSGSLANETLVISLCQIPFTGVPIPSGAISGTKTNNAAAAGTVGEFTSSNVASGSAVSLTTATAANIASVSLTAGEWDVYGNVEFISAATTTVSTLSGWVSSTSATAPTDANSGGVGRISFPGGGTAINDFNIIATGPKRFILSSTTTIYLSAIAYFGVSTTTGCGFIGARRVR